MYTIKSITWSENSLEIIEKKLQKKHGNAIHFTLNKSKYVNKIWTWYKRYWYYYAFTLIWVNWIYNSRLYSNKEKMFKEMIKNIKLKYDFKHLKSDAHNYRDFFELVLKNEKKHDFDLS